MLLTSSELFVRYTEAGRTCSRVGCLSVLVLQQCPSFVLSKTKYVFLHSKLGSLIFVFFFGSKDSENQLFFVFVLIYQKFELWFSLTHRM